MGTQTESHPIWGAFLLDEQVYTPVTKHEKPLRRGFMLLLTILVVVGIAKSVGLGLELLATPRLDLIEDGTYKAIVDTTWYAEQSALTADFAVTFAQLHSIGWQVGRLIGGVPSGIGIATIFIAQLLYGLLSWLIYGSLTHSVARWLGGTAGYKPFMGAFALTYAPLIFTAVTIIPRLTLASGLVYLWMMATRYQAIKQSHQLGWVQSLAAVVIPQIILFLLVPTIVLLVLGLFVA